MSCVYTKHAVYCNVAIVVLCGVCCHGGACHLVAIARASILIPYLVAKCLNEDRASANEVFLNLELFEVP